MPSSPERTSRNIDFVEKNLKNTIQNGLKESIINEYLEVLQEDLLLENQDEFNLNMIQQDEQENNERDFLMNNFATLSENAELNRQRFESLRDSVDTLYIQQIAETETFRRQQNDRVNKMKSLYQSEFNKVSQELDEVNNEYNKIEQELRDQISLENTTKNARMYEMKSNLQRQIIDKRNDLVQAITEGNVIKHELDNLKEQLEQNRNKNKMYFQINYVDQQSTLNKPANNQANYPRSNNLQDKLLYTTTEQNRFPVANDYGFIDKHYEQIVHQVPEKEIDTNHTSNIFLEKLNNENKTFDNIATNHQQKNVSNTPVSHSSNLKPKPFSYATNTDTVDQVELKEQSSSKETAKDDDADEIVSSNSSEVTINLHPPRKVPTVYFGTTKTGQFYKERN